MSSFCLMKEEHIHIYKFSKTYWETALQLRCQKEECWSSAPLCSWMIDISCSLLVMCIVFEWGGRRLQRSNSICSHKQYRILLAWRLAVRERPRQCFHNSHSQNFPFSVWLVDCLLTILMEREMGENIGKDWDGKRQRGCWLTVRSVNKQVTGIRWQEQETGAQGRPCDRAKPRWETAPRRRGKSQRQTGDIHRRKTS